MLPRDILEQRQKLGYRGIPAPPRNLQIQSGSLEVLLVWNQPADLRGVDKFYVYQGDENNRVWQSVDGATQQVRLKVPADTATAFYISSVSKAGRESKKVQIIGKANSDQLVVSGTSGGTGGSSPPPPSGWTDEPTGGGQSRRYVL